MDKQSLSEKEASRPAANTDGSKLNTLEGLTNNTSDSQSVQEDIVDSLANLFGEIDDERNSRVYLVCDRVQIVKGKYRVYAKDVSDVRRAK